MEKKIPDIEDVSSLLVEYASTLALSGAHSMRIQQNVKRMGGTFGYEVELSAFQLSIMLTITDKNDPHKIFTQIKKIGSLVLNFTIVSELSALSWDTYDKQLSYDEVKTAYNDIISQKRMSRWIVLILVGFANAAFCALFHGDVYAICLVFFSTLVGFFIRQEMIHRHVNHLITFTTSAFAASMFAGLGYVFNLGTTPEIALASSVLYLIPGVPLINSTLDILHGHTLTGIARLINASILIVCIAIGLFSAMLLLGLEKL